MDEPELLKGPTLSPDGTVEGRPTPEPSAAPSPARPGPEPDAPLELARRPPPKAWSPPTAYRPEPSRRPRWLPLALGGLVVAGLAIAVAAATIAPASPPRAPSVVLPAPLRDALPTLSTPPLVIQSEPSGATVRSPAGVLGVTPWAGNNPFLVDTRLTLTLEGYQPRTVVAPGAKEAHLSLTLKKAAP